MAILKWLILGGLALALLAVMAVLAGQLGLWRGTPPADLGVRDGKLKPPSRTSNSVSSQAALWPDHPQALQASIAPLPLVGDGPTTLARIKAIVASTPGAQLVGEGPDYLYATFSTRLMKYTDDVEFCLDPAAQVVHVRSASRLGQRDLGTNRSRIEAIRTQLQAH
jgi:uncharacterized protein (DUF1499 family)